MSEKKDKTFLSSREAAELLGVAVSTIQLWTNNGLLRAWTTGGGHRRILRSSVEEILRQQQAVSDDQKQERQMSVVVVEDDAQQQLLYKKHFRAWRMNVNMVIAEDGYEGLIKIGCIFPDVIITDLLMPKMDGFQMVRAIKELPELKHSLIIVVTVLTDREVKKKGGLPKGVHLFTKPVPFEKLKVLLDKKAHANTAKHYAIG